MVRVSPLPVLLCVLASSLAAAAQEPAAPPKPKKDFPWHSGEFKVGMFAASTDTGLEVKSSGGAGVTYDLEDALGLNESVTAFRMEGSISLGARHRLHFDYLSVSRKGDRSSGEAIQIGDVVFPVGAELESESEFQLYMLTYGYSLLQDERIDFAVTFGIHAVHSSVEVDARNLDLHKSANVFLPIPLPGLRCDVAITPDFWLRQRAEFIWLGYGQYSGVLSDLSIRLEYAFSDTFSAGAGFNAVHGRLESDKDDASGVRFDGSFEFGFSGLMLYAGVQF